MKEALMTFCCFYHSVSFQKAAQAVAYAYDLDLFGYGENELEALSDLRRTVVDLYLELRENHAHLAGEALAIWHYLNQVVRRTERP